MTQMGLDYAKYKESQRHNMQDEAIRSRSNDINEMDADTRAYTASFKPIEMKIEQQKADASTSQAKSSSRQAGVAERKQALDERYRERETLVKESQADSASRQATASLTQASAASRTASAKQAEVDLKELKTWLESLPEVVRGTYAQNYFDDSTLSQVLAPMITLVDRLIPSLSIGVKR